MVFSPTSPMHPVFCLERAVSYISPPKKESLDWRSDSCCGRGIRIYNFLSTQQRATLSAFYFSHHVAHNKILLLIINLSENVVPITITQDTVPDC